MALLSQSLFTSLAVASSTVLFAAGSYLWYYKPQYIIKFRLRVALYKSGAKLKYIYTHASKLKIFFIEKGVPSKDRPSWLLIHGFSSSKESWLQLVKRLNKDEHVIAVDLLGHGQSDIPISDPEINVFNLTETIYEILEQIEPKDLKFHVIGTSMGGLIAAIFAANYPNRVELLSLICPALFPPTPDDVLETPERVEMMRRRLLADNVDDLIDMLKMNVYDQRLILTNRQILYGIVQMRLPKLDFLQKLFVSIRHYRVEYYNYIKKIEAPTQIIWGKEDQVIDISRLPGMKEMFNTCKRVDILEKCGHAVSWDCPVELLENLKSFRVEKLIDKN